jgi:NAD-dependent SIR2 family protein deacetylase
MSGRETGGQADPLAAAAGVVREATALLIAAGAGMGVDSGLPDFRGPEGFWNAYPAYRHLGLGFQDLANPAWFRDDPALAWGFYGHRLELYRRTEPHEGYAVLRRWASRARDGAFVFTSNVDGHFGRAGFAADRVVECHGSLEWLQCLDACAAGLFSSEPFRVDVDPVDFRARGPLPQCPGCGGLARPNVLMFGDWDWDASRTGAQEHRLQSWLSGVAGRSGVRIAIVECGAGTGVPTVRLFSERLARGAGSRLLRINVREPHGPAGTIGIAAGAREALRGIDAVLDAS